MPIEFGQTVFAPQSIRFEYALKTESNNQEILKQITQTFSIIKEYVKNAKDCKHKISIVQTKQLTDESCRKERSTIFMIADLRRSIGELINDFSIDLGLLTDTELIQLKAELSSKSDQLIKASEKYELILQTPFTKAEILLDVKNLGHEYEKMIKCKHDYSIKLNELIQKRDVYKNKMFNESKLNIRIEKFSGSSDSSSDFYITNTTIRKI